MRLVAVFFPEQLLEAINDLIREGYFPSRSAAIRSFVRDSLRNHPVYGKFLNRVEVSAKLIQEINKDRILVFQVRCISCKHVWLSTAPKRCPKCESRSIVIKSRG